MNQDILFEVCTRADNKILEAFSRSTIWTDMKSFISTEYYWHRRTQHLINREFEYREPQEGDSWKRTYYMSEDLILRRNIKGYSPFIYPIVEDELATYTLLKAGYDPRRGKSLETACEIGSLAVIHLLLEDKRVDSTHDSSRVLRYACTQNGGRPDVVRLLLEDGRADPTVQDGYCLYQAVNEGHTEIVRLLLEDGRVSPRINNNSSIKIACRRPYLPIIALLLEDKRIDWNIVAELSRDVYNDQVIQLLRTSLESSLR